MLQQLDAIYEETTKEGSNFHQEVKKIEAVTNHDIKAVEYWIKGKIEKSPEIDYLVEFVHFTCTSEDINNISYALMLKESLAGVMLPEFDRVYSMMRGIALEVKNLVIWIDLKNADVVMMGRTHG